MSQNPGGGVPAAAPPPPPQYSQDGQWYWTGAAWVPNPWVSNPWAPSWKGSQYGRPATGPGSLASPLNRFLARLLDGLIGLAGLVVLGGIAVAIVAPHAGRMFPPDNPDPNAGSPTPGFLWIYLTVLASGFVVGCLYVIYDAATTARYGRTFGKARLKIREIQLDGSPVTFWRAFGRAAAYWFSGFLSWIGLLNPLWCLWDANSQCLHDKIVGTLVIND